MEMALEVSPKNKSNRSYEVWQPGRSSCWLSCHQEEHGWAKCPLREKQVIRLTMAVQEGSWREPEWDIYVQCVECGTSTEKELTGRNPQ